MKNKWSLKKSVKKFRKYRLVAKGEFNECIYAKEVWQKKEGKNVCQNFMNNECNRFWYLLTLLFVIQCPHQMNDVLLWIWFGEGSLNDTLFLTSVICYRCSIYYTHTWIVSRFSFSMWHNDFTFAIEYINDGLSTIETFIIESNNNSNCRH